MYDAASADGDRSSEVLVSALYKLVKGSSLQLLSVTAGTVFMAPR